MPERPRDGSERTNAIVGWVLLGVVALSAVQSLLAERYVWAVVEVGFVAVAALPALALRDWRVLVPWPVLAVGAAALAAASLGLHQELTAYTALAAVSIVGVAELEAYTEVEMSRRFAIVFAVLTTMALQGLWTILQYYADEFLGTNYIVSQADLQWDFVLVTLVAFVVGGAFELYFKRAEGDGGHEEPTVNET